MRHAAERGQSLTGQLLAFSRRQHLRPESLDVSALVRGFEPLIRRAIGENIAVEITIGEDPAVCEVDASQLETTLLNLAVNARDAMPDGGTLRIAVRRVEHDADLMVRHSDATPGPWIALSMDDTGCGMPREVLNRAFEPFFTTKEPGKGSGLGLSQVYGFVRQSGGFVTLTSDVGAGTQLSIYLPPSSKPMAAPRFIPPAEPAAHTRSETVLLVEDDAAVLAVGIEMLTDLGYRVITASDAGGALEILRRGRPVDLIFTDVVMPGGKTGVQLADEARALRPQIKVLLTSGYTGEALARHQPNHSDWPIIAKPFRQPDLAASIRKILESDALPA
jgi:CheY-like chemotaxis protein